MKCKVINTSKDNMESDVNSWLDSEKIEIFDIIQHINDIGYVTLTIFYYDKNEVRSKKLNKLNSKQK